MEDIFKVLCNDFKMIGSLKNDANIFKTQKEPVIIGIIGFKH